MRRSVPRSPGIVLAAAVLVACGSDDVESITPLGTFDPGRNATIQQLDSQLIPGSGVWAITLDHKVQIDLGDGTPPVVADTVLYDADNDVLTVTVDGVAFDLSDLAPFGDGTLDSSGCAAGPPPICVSDDRAVVSTLYAQSDRLAISDGVDVETEGFAVFGVKTAAADMPLSGSADYSGSSVYLVDFAGTPDDLAGAPTMTVDFSTGDVTYADSASGAASTLSIDASATISGNAYGGTVTGGIYDADGDTTNTTGDQLLLQETGSLFAGTFYGPPPDDPSGGSETSGVVSADGAAGGSVIGTFGVQLDLFTP